MTLPQLTPVAEDRLRRSATSAHEVSRSCVVDEAEVEPADAVREGAAGHHLGPGAEGTARLLEQDVVAHRNGSGTAHIAQSRVSVDF